MALTCPYCSETWHRSTLPSRHTIGEPVWIRKNAQRESGVVVGVTFLLLSIQYLVQTDAGTRRVTCRDVTARPAAPLRLEQL